MHAACERLFTSMNGHCMPDGIPLHTGAPQQWHYNGAMLAIAGPPIEYLSAASWMRAILKSSFPKSLQDARCQTQQIAVGANCSSESPQVRGAYSAASAQHGLSRCLLSAREILGINCTASARTIFTLTSPACSRQPGAPLILTVVEAAGETSPGSVGPKWRRRTTPALRQSVPQGRLRETV